MRHRISYTKLTMPIEYTLLSILIALVQVALYLFVGRAALWIFAGVNRDRNFIYSCSKRAQSRWSKPCASSPPDSSSTATCRS